MIGEKVVGFYFSHCARKCLKFTTDHKIYAERQLNSTVRKYKYSKMKSLERTHCARKNKFDIEAIGCV